MSNRGKLDIRCVECGRQITADEFEFFVPEDEEDRPICCECINGSQYGALLKEPRL